MGPNMLNQTNPCMNFSHKHSLQSQSWHFLVKLLKLKSYYSLSYVLHDGTFFMGILVQLNLQKW